VTPCILVCTHPCFGEIYSLFLQIRRASCTLETEVAGFCLSGNPFQLLSCEECSLFVRCIDNRIVWLQVARTFVLVTIWISVWMQESLVISCMFFMPSLTEQVSAAVTQQACSAEVSGSRPFISKHFIYLGKTVTNQNWIKEKVKEWLLPFGAESFASSLISKSIKMTICGAVILPFVLSGCKAWSFTLRKEHRLRMFENRVLRKIFWHKNDEVTWQWVTLHNEELYDLFPSPNFIRVIYLRRMS